eukprot:8296460-Karenia_brevis.AAC.1
MRSSWPKPKSKIFSLRPYGEATPLGGPSAKKLKNKTGNQITKRGPKGNNHALIGLSLIHI